MIYLDNAATTKPCAEAIAGSAYAMTQAFGNPSSLHKLGIRAEELVEFSKEKIAAALGGLSREIIFTSGATEANNLALFGLSGVYGRHRRKIVTTAVEHPSVAEPAKKLREQGFEVVFVSPGADGNIGEDDLVGAVDENTCLVSAMYVNNETGHILPIEGAFARIKKLYPECILHTDCVQAFMKLPFKAKSLGADAISLSAHKIHGPKGVGALWLKNGLRISPQLLGGGQQNGLRSGTEAVPLIYSFGKTVEAMSKTLPERLAHAEDIAEYCRKRLSEIGAAINSPEEGSPYIISASVGGLKSETLLHFLEQQEIYVSSGSACSRGKKSVVLKAFGLPDAVSDSTVRISTSVSTTREDIDALVSGIDSALKTLVKIKR